MKYYRIVRQNLFALTYKINTGGSVMVRTWFVFFFSFIALSIALSGEAIPAKKLYDDFSTGYLSGDKWFPREYVKEIRDGKLVCKLGNSSGMDAEYWPGMFRNDLQVVSPAPETVTAFACEVTIMEAKTDSAPNARSFAGIAGQFYNSKDSDGQAGEIRFDIMIGDRGNGGLEAFWEASRVMENDPSDFEQIAGGTLIGPGTLYPGATYHVTLIYDNDRTLTFGVNGITDNYTGPEKKRPAVNSNRSLAACIDAENGANDGFIHATFDNVVFNNASEIHEDFSSPLIDLSKWGQTESVRECAWGYLRTSTRRDNGWNHSSTNFITEKDTPYLEAKVRIESDSQLSPGATAIASLGGYYYNDSRGPGSGVDYNQFEGDVFAQIRLSHDSDENMEAQAWAGRANDAGGNGFTELFGHSFSTPVALDTYSVLSMAYENNRIVFQCEDEQAVFNIQTEAYPPYGIHRQLSAGLTDSGYIKASFDDIYTAGSSVVTTILSNTSPNHTITRGSNENEQVYGTATSNMITLESGARAELINFPGQNNIQVQTSSDLFTVSRSGSVVTFQGSDGTALKIPATTEGQTLAFTDRSPMVLKIHENQVMLDGQVIVTETSDISNHTGYSGIPENEWIPINWDLKIMDGALPPGTNPSKHHQRITHGYGGLAYNQQSGETLVMDGYFSTHGDGLIGKTSIYANALYGMDPIHQEYILHKVNNYQGGYTPTPRLDDEWTPAPRHTYDYWAYAAPTNSVYMLKGANKKLTYAVNDKTKQLIQKYVPDPWINNGQKLLGMWRYAFDDSRWYSLHTSAIFPDSRTMEGALIYVPEEERIYLFPIAREKIYSFDIHTQEWRDEKVSINEWNRYRGATFLDTKRNRVVFYSGKANGSSTGCDLGVFDLETQKFSVLDVTGSKPPAPRSDGAIAYDPKHDLYVTFGGAGTYTDNWVFNPNDNSWRQFKPGKNIPLDEEQSHLDMVYDSKNDIFVLSRAQGAPGSWFFLRFNPETAQFIESDGSDPADQGSSDPVITSFAVREKAGKTTDKYPVTIGHPFARGDVPAGSVVNFQTVGGVLLDTQYECKRTWTDGSCKHAVLSTIIPRIPANEKITLYLVEDSGFDDHADGELDKTAILATDIESDISLTNLSGCDYTGDRTVSMRDVISAGTIGTNPYTRAELDYWLSGDVVTDILIRAPILDDSGRKQLWAFWEARFYPGTAYGIRITAGVENVEGHYRGDMTYDVEIEIGETSPLSVYSNTAVDHHHAGRWVKRFWLGDEPSLVEYIYNKEYLFQETMLLPNHDTSLEITEDTIANGGFYNRGYSAWTASDRDIMEFSYFAFTGTGQRPEDCIYPEWQIRYLMTGDYRLREMVIGGGDLAGGMPRHWRESDGSGTGTTGQLHRYPFAEDGHIISISGRPRVWTTIKREDSSQSREDALPSPDLGEQSPNGDIWGGYSGYGHSADLSYIPYLITGDRYYLDELYYWAGYVGTHISYEYRGYDNGRIVPSQVRGKAWGIRDVLDAATLAPDDEAEKDYFENWLYNTWEFYNTDEASGIDNYSPIYNFGMVSSGGSYYINPWMEHYIVAILGTAAERGYSDTNLIELRNKHASFIINMVTHPDFNKWLSVSYSLPADDEAGNFVESWAQFYSLFVAANEDWTQEDFESASYRPDAYSASFLGATSYITDLAPEYAPYGTGQVARDFAKAHVFGSRALQLEAFAKSPLWSQLPRGETTGGGGEESTPLGRGSAHFGAGATIFTKGADTSSLGF